MEQPTTRIELGRVAQDLQLKRKQVESVVELLDAGNTVPFITRYRKEQTGNLDEEQIRDIQHRVNQLRQMAERRDTILRTIEAQGKLTPELKAAIEAASTSKRLEDLYLPYKPKKQTLATIARQRGLGPLAEAIWNRDEVVNNLNEIMAGLIDPEKQLNTVEDVRAGVGHILAERIAEDAEVREAARKVVWGGKLVSTKAAASKEPAAAETQEAAPPPTVGGPSPGERDAEFRNYFDYSEPARQVPPHRTLALNRGERQGILKVRIELDREKLEHDVHAALPLEGHPHAEILKACAADALDRLLLRSLDREVRGELTEAAEHHAVGVFARNLRNLLLQPPVPGRRVLAIDPGYRTGCKFAVLDEIGNLLEHGVLFPHVKRKKKKRKGKKAVVFGLTEAEQKTFAVGIDIPETTQDAATQTAIAESPEANIPVSAEGSLTDDAAPAPEPESGEQPTNSSGAESASSEGPEPTGDDQEQPPVLKADSYHRSTGPGDEFDGSIDPPEEAPEAEVNHEPEASETGDQPVADFQAAEKEAVAESEEAAPPVASPAWAGIVIPPPETDEEKAEGRPAERKRSGPKPKREPKEPRESGDASRSLSKRDRSKQMIATLCRKHKVGVIAIGNGTACRETEELVAEVIDQELKDVPYLIVNEAGASVYSASAIGREEFPEFDATLRGTISIGRRLQDPLSELVKIDPQSIGVGLYQHDVNPRLLKESLSEVVESCVNYVGVDLNTASVPLLQYVSGLNQLRARNLVEYRNTHGPFKSREEIKEVNGVGPAVFTQAAGFLKITGGDQPFDSTWIHPESYVSAEKALSLLGYDPQVLHNRAEMEQLRKRLSELNPAELATEVGVGDPTVQDILDNLARPGRDPREDLPKPIFKTGILKLGNLTPGMQLKGTVLNVVDFGVFVDIGLKDSGLVHISQLANRYIRSPHEVVAVGDIVTTWVLNVDHERRRVSLTMIEPGTDRTQERRPRRPPRREGHQQAQAQGQQQQAAQGQGDAGQHQGQQGQQQGQRYAGRRQPQQGERRPPRQRPPRQNDQAGQEGGERRKPKRNAPPVTLSAEALEGKEVLHTFGELKALFEHKKKQPPKSEA